MRIHLTIKRIAALVLIASFFLPLSQCTWSVPVGETAIAYETHDLSAFSAYSWPSIEGAIAAIMFSWAAVIQLISLRMPNFQFKRTAFALEIALSTFTVLGVTWVIYWGQHIRYGAVIAYVGVFAYLLATLAAHTNRRHPNSTVERDARKSGARPSP